MDISIVIPSYNTQSTIGDTLQSLETQNTALAWEVILVDCSEHDEVEQVANRYQRVHYHHRATRFNPGEGRNIGAGIAQGQLLVFLDSDVVLAPASLQAAWDNFMAGRRIFGGALELDTQKSQGLAPYLEHFFFNHESQAGRPFCERSNLSSALMCFSREIFLAEGGFKDIPRMQDTELTERLRSKGHTLYFCPDVLAYQTQDSPLDKVLRKIFINGQNLYYIRYRPGITALRKAAFFILLPPVTLIKTLRIAGRHLLYQSARNRLVTLALLPALLVGGAWWMAGFYHALITEKGIGTTR